MASSKRDYYEILSVPRNAPDEEIKKAYRKCALQWHPDRNPGNKKAEDNFKEATEAYQVLADPQKRKIYDQLGHEGLNSQGFGASGFSSAGFGDIFEDIFENFFSGGSGGSRRARPQKGSDLGATLEISLEEAAFGAEKTIDIQREESCSHCGGEGAKPGTEKKVCPTCRGTGQVLASSGFFSISRSCPKCHGQGEIIEYPCPECHGSGRRMARRKIQTKVPAGVDTGVRMKISGEGEAGHRGGPRGDLYVEIHMKPHEIFTREGDDLVCLAPISMTQAALGGEILVPTLKGTIALKIPAGTQSGKSFILKGKGFHSLRGHGTGDEEVRIQVETPTRLTLEQAELLQRFAEISGEKVNPVSAGFVNKVKKLFS
jgi:molecular chaperone DnaJ